MIIEPGHGPLYEYSVATVGQLMLVLKPHVLRIVHNDLIEHEADFPPKNRRELSALIEFIDELLINLEGEP